MYNSDSQEITHSNYSLQADLATGWMPKLKIIGPMPLNFDNPQVDKSIMALVHQQSPYYQVVYLGSRPLSSFKLHELIANNYRYKYSYLLQNDFAHLKPFFKKFYSLFEPKIKRPFYGMNPELCKKQLVFDSCFEGGNLDCAIRVKSQEYDLFLRVDSNTVGHVMWYYFRVTNPENTDKVVRFNLVNLRRNKSAYSRGMRPFVKRSQQIWKQDGENVQVTQQKIKYLKESLPRSPQQNNPNSILFRKLSFQLKLQAGQTVEIAYGIPYMYSQLLEDIKVFKKRAQLLEGIQLSVELQHETLSGLEIPVIKLRLGPPGNGKYCVFMIGRQHPGQSNSSYVIKGTIQQLLSGSQSTLKVLRNCDFVIIPMLNPDGVVAGNFRTSLFGKDLNRLFKTNDVTLVPQVRMCRDLFAELFQTYRKKLLLFLDYHGHSTRKNAFVLGPGIFDAQLINDIRILPKIIANYTEIFRYPSCSFRLDGQKRTTARALFGKLAGLSYTIQTSNWAYYSQSTGQIIEMNVKLFEQLGMCLCKGFEQYIISRIEKRQKYNWKTKQETARKIKIVKSKQELKLRVSVTSRQKTQLLPRNKQARIYTEAVIKENQSQIKKGRHIGKQQVKQALVEQANSSDEMSNSGMDTDSEGEGMENDKFQKYIKAASEMLIEFQKMYYGNNYRKALSKYRSNNLNMRSNKIFFQQQKKKLESVQACLRPSIQKSELFIKVEEAGKNIRENKKTIQLEDSLHINSKTGVSKSQRDNKTKEDKSEPNKIKFLQPNRKGKIRVNGNIREPLGMTQEVIRIEKVELTSLEKSVHNVKSRSIEKMSLSQRQQTNISLNNKKETRLELPSIKISRMQEQPSKGSTNVNVSQVKGIKLNELLMTEQHLARSFVLNILEKSKIDKDRSFKYF